MKPRKVPMRTCVGCRTVRPKRELIRVVRDPQGELHVDATGKKSGRGAYICPTAQCLRDAVNGKRLERALERPVPQEVLHTLEAELGAL